MINAKVNGQVKLSDKQVVEVELKYNSHGENHAPLPSHLRISINLRRKSGDGMKSPKDTIIMSMAEMEEVNKLMPLLKKEVKRQEDILSTVGSVESSAADLESAADNYRQGLINFDEFRNEVETIIDDLRDIV